ncbi:NAD(P)-binding protein [Bacillus sp. PS06]|uniref:NAD(P)-binding protein n=1 Tax=Bacillus sp. PS06 TaxID=2764176 RepID=UPI00177DEC7D|nr:NAD(P)-binding protein [Bacillus sp. PS06]MBD8071275.1 NAD(P)-binding protein [Bacillus sp. PS06]
MLPIMLDLLDRQCVVIGGGKIAARKIKKLLNTGAKIVVISPFISDEIKELANEQKLVVLEREVLNEDYKDAFLVIAATDSFEVNQEIVSNVKSNQLICVVNKHELGNVHIPASFSRGKLQISVSTSGASPHLAKKIRNKLMNTYDESYEEYLDFLNECRLSLKELTDQGLKAQLLEELIDEKYLQSTSEREQFKKRNHL